MTVRSSSASTQSPFQVRVWRFGLPLLFQVLLILLIPAQAAYTYFAGSSVILQTVPVDPYSLLQGYYVTLRYEISQGATLEQLPGWSTIQDTRLYQDPALLAGADSFYVILEEPRMETDSNNSDEATSQKAQSPPAWIPVRVVGDRPESLPSNQVALKGRYGQSGIVYGLEQYFIPEDQRDEINERIRETQISGNPQSYVVEVSVTKDGNAVPVSLWIEGENYRF